jgi:hypothetical protein
MLNVRNYALDVSPEDHAGKDVRSEVAVTALGVAEGDRDIKAQGHRD